MVHRESSLHGISQNNYNFTKSSLTQSYILIINDPYEVYQKIKTQNDNDQEKARNIFLNLDNQAEKQIIGKIIDEQKIVNGNLNLINQLELKQKEKINSIWQY